MIVKGGIIVPVDGMIHNEIQAAIERIAKEPLLQGVDSHLIAEDIRSGIENLLKTITENQIAMYVRLHRGDPDWRTK